ncbi:MAG: DUF4231 domain-containing protein [Synechococcales cyanobacterium K44_A2020_017]|nr:DUF4231 domain-containing protein [Synechococcales cyanobacterium K32_A2020_035]MBF2094277.1 DUF4231 domain-containing protein [Synechococcales cyanobacterium K44_A2020_017]
MSSASAKPPSSSQPPTPKPAARGTPASTTSQAANPGHASDSPQPRTPVLEDAWQRFGDYDKNAVKAQKAFIRQRKWVASLGVASTTIAVLYLVLEVALGQEGPPLSDFIQSVATGRLRNTNEAIMGSMSLLVILLPILVTILIAASIKFNMGVNWVMLRGSAETLKKEIYRYRTQVDIYAADASEIREVVLARKIKIVGKHVMETQVNQSGLDVYDGELPPPYGAARSRGDDGFSDLSADLYLIYRLEDQFDYYRKKAQRLGRELTQLQWWVYILGGVGTLLAAVGFEVWVAVSSSFAAAFAGFLEFKRVEPNLISCNTAASDLYDLRAWWRALPETARQQQANIEALVNGTEQIIQGENSSWVQEMRDALAELYGDQEQVQADQLQNMAEQGTLINVRGDDREIIQQIVVGPMLDPQEEAGEPEEPAIAPDQAQTSIDIDISDDDDMDISSDMNVSEADPGTIAGPDHVVLSEFNDPDQVDLSEFNVDLSDFFDPADDLPTTSSEEQDAQQTPDDIDWDKVL